MDLPSSLEMSSSAVALEGCSGGCLLHCNLNGTESDILWRLIKVKLNADMLQATCLLPRCSIQCSIWLLKLMRTSIVT